jgi:2-dehydro-3-deoxyphosphogalactonate aldolase
MFLLGGLTAMLCGVPAGTPMWPVGGVTPETRAGWFKVGATGFGIGGALYTPGVTIEQLGERATAFVNTWRGLAA